MDSDRLLTLNAPRTGSSSTLKIGSLFTQGPNDAKKKKKNKTFHIYGGNSGSSQISHTSVASLLNKEKASKRIPLSDLNVNVRNELETPKNRVLSVSSMLNSNDNLVRDGNINNTSNLDENTDQYSNPVKQAYEIELTVADEDNFERSSIPKEPLERLQDTAAKAAISYDSEGVADSEEEVECLSSSQYGQNYKSNSQQTLEMKSFSISNGYTQMGRYHDSDDIAGLHFVKYNGYEMSDTQLTNENFQSEDLSASHDRGCDGEDEYFTSQPLFTQSQERSEINQLDETGSLPHLRHDSYGPPIERREETELAENSEIQLLEGAPAAVSVKKSAGKEEEEEKSQSHNCSSPLSDVGASDPTTNEKGASKAEAEDDDVILTGPWYNPSQSSKDITEYTKSEGVSQSSHASYMITLKLQHKSIDELDKQSQTETILQPVSDRKEPNEIVSRVHNKETFKKRKAASLADIISKTQMPLYRRVGLSKRSKIDSLHTNLKNRN